jgi:hypothetical protein
MEVAMKPTKILLSMLLAAAVSLTTLPAASAASSVVDSYCSPTGDYCTLIVKKADGSIVFSIRAFANYFGKAQACVKKETRVCHSTSPRKDGGLYFWNIRRQGNYPNEGPGEYKLRWRDSGGNAIGPALYFRRG